MNRFIISVIILIAIIASSFSVPIYLKKTTTELISKIDEIQNYVDNDNLETAYTNINKFITLWEDKKDIITIFVNHSEMDSITYFTSKLPSLLKYNDKSEFSAELNHVKTIILSVYNDDIPNLKNII